MPLTHWAFGIPLYIARRLVAAHPAVRADAAPSVLAVGRIPTLRFVFLAFERLARPIHR